MSINETITVMPDIENAPKQNLLNSIRNIRRDYDEPSKGSIHEALQNMVDAYGRNFVKKAIIEAGLKCYFEISSGENEVYIRDNAGGMTRDVLTENLIAIDNPSEHKDSGEGLGCLGRGVWVLLALGKVSRIEVNSPEEDGIMTTVVRTRGDESALDENERLVGYSDIERIDVEESELGLEDQYGTAYKIGGVKDEFMNVLSDWEVMEKSLIKRFAPLWTYFDDIKFTYTIDGVENKVDAPDLEELKHKHMIREVEKVGEFEYYGEKHKVKNAVFIDARDLEGGAPWDGFLMVKGNEYFEYPFMTVDIYRPQLPSTMGESEMFGWVDVTDVCRQREDGRILENNSHTSINISNKWENMGLRSLTTEVHDNIFKKERARENDKEAFERAKKKANEVIDDLDFDEELDINLKGGSDGVPTPPNPSSDGPKIINCKVSKREFNIGEEIIPIVEVNIPDDPSYESYMISNVCVKRIDDGGEFNYDKGRENTAVVTSRDYKVGGPISPNPEVGGKYRLTAELYGVKETGELSNKPVSSSRETFYVGEPPTEGEPGPGDDDKVLGLVSNVTHSGSQPIVSLVKKDEDGGGLEARLDLGDARVERIKENNRGDAVKNKLDELFANWILEGVVNYWLREELNESNSNNPIENVREMRSIKKQMKESLVINNE